VRGSEAINGTSALNRRLMENILRQHVRSIFRKPLAVPLVCGKCALRYC
jgi:hypothetical protein